MSAVRYRQVVKAAMLMVPSLRPLVEGSTGGTNEGAYCYSVWMRHLVSLSRLEGFRLPSVVAELGPGDSLGIGMTALLSGAQRYVGLDVVPFAQGAANSQVLDEILPLLRGSVPIPTHDYPEVRPLLTSYAFPHDILRNLDWESLLNPHRIDEIRRSVMDPGPSGVVSYLAPWVDIPDNERAAVDLVMSQAVLEHVADIDVVHRSTFELLRSGGFVSHQIDFRSHSLASTWDGHLAIGPRTWSFLSRNRPYLLNRLPLSRHVESMEAAGFTIEFVAAETDRSTVPGEVLEQLWGRYTPDDALTASAHIVARK